MSGVTRAQVTEAVKALVAAALPNADVVGLTAADAKPDRIAPGGRAVVYAGDPGEPEVDLSPLTYHYSHAFPVELSAYDGADGASADAALNAMMTAIGGAVIANRTLGGLCSFLEARAPEFDDLDHPGARPARTAEIEIVADYATSRPI